MERESHTDLDYEKGMSVGWLVGQLPVVADSKPPPPLYFVPQGDERESSVPSELRLLIPDRKLNAPTVIQTKIITRRK